MWQDWVISIIQWVFILTMVPTILDRKQKPAIISSVFSALGLYTFAAVYFTFGLWSSVLSSFILASEWALLAYQRRKLDKENKEKATGWERV